VIGAGADQREQTRRVGRERGLGEGAAPTRLAMGFGGPGLLAAMPAAALDSRPYPSTPHARPQPLKEAPVTRGWTEWRDPDAGMDSSVTHASSKLQLVTDWGKMVRATLVP
jgi:hypothetical protein